MLDSVATSIRGSFAGLHVSGFGTSDRFIGSARTVVRGVTRPIRALMGVASTRYLRDGVGKSSHLLEYTRVASIGFAAILALLLLPSLVPGVFSNSSRRAVVNARVTLVTSPISGRILQGPATSGQRFRAGDVVARIENSTIDRSVLMELKLQALGAAERSSVLQTDYRQQQQRMRELDEQISRLTSQVMLQLTATEGESRAKLAAATASANVRRTMATRMQPLLQSKTINRSHMDLLEQQADAAEADKTAAQHALEGKVAALEAAGRGVYIGEAFGLLTGLQQQRIAAEAAVKKLSAEHMAVTERSQALKQLITEEALRLGSLSEAVIVAPTDSFVLDVEQLQGQFVDAGTKIVRTTTCETAVVTAVFPVSMVSELSLGAPIDVELQDEDLRVTGRVSRILPRDTDRASEKLWVPLPPAQTNEVHVLVSLDTTFSNGLSDENCHIGSWVRASVEGRWQRALASIGHQIYASMSQSLELVAGVVLPATTARNEKAPPVAVAQPAALLRPLPEPPPQLPEPRHAPARVARPDREV